MTSPNVISPAKISLIANRCAVPSGDYFLFYQPHVSLDSAALYIRLQKRRLQRGVYKAASTKHERLRNFLIKNRRPKRAACPVRCTPALEVESQLRRQRSRGNVVRPTEGGEEVVERVFVGQVNNGKLRTPFVLVAVKQIVMTE